MTLLTKEQIESANDLATEVIPVPEWGGELMIQEFSGDVRDTVMAKWRECDKAGDWTGLRPLVASLSIVGDDRKPYFSKADVAKLGAKSSDALDRVFSTAAKLSKLLVQDQEETEKN